MARKTRKKQRPHVGLLGKALTRRSRGKCELCASREGVRPFELWPFPEEPEMDRTLMACARCRLWMERETMDPVEGGFLCEAVWAELPAVRLAAARILLSHEQLTDPWLVDALEVARVDPTTGEFYPPSEALSPR